MDERMRAHIEKLFEEAPKTRKAFELREELLGNSEERYQDLVAEGMKPEDACMLVINSIGNVSELFEGLEDAGTDYSKIQEAQYKKIVMVKTAAVGLYIFSVVQFLALGLMSGYMYFPIDLTMIGFIVMLLLAIIPTCMLVYIGNMYPKYKRKDNTVVEEFKEWKSSSHKSKSVKTAVLFVAWTFILVLYFGISFATFDWYATWIIFLVGACVHAIIELLYRLKEDKQR